MQYVVQCMIVHEWNVWAFIFSSFLVFSKIQNANVMPQLCRWNTMIGLTNVICEHCVLTCYWQTLNHYLDVNFLWMRTKYDASLDFSFLIQMLLDKDAKKFFVMQMPHAGMQSLFMMMLVHVFKSWCKCLLTKMEIQMSSDGHVRMQMFWRKHNLFKNSLYFQNQGFFCAWN